MYALCLRLPRDDGFGLFWEPLNFAFYPCGKKFDRSFCSKTESNPQTEIGKNIKFPTFPSSFQIMSNSFTKVRVFSVLHVSLRISGSTHKILHRGRK